MGALTLVIVFVIFTTLAAVFLAIGAAVAGIEGRTFGKAMAATVGVALLSLAAGVVLSLVGLGDSFFGGVIGIAVNLAVIRGVYGTSWGKAVLAWFIELVAFVVLVVVPVVMLGGVAALLR